MAEFKEVFVQRARTDLSLIVSFVARKANLDIAECVGMQLIDKALSIRTLQERGRIVPEIKSATIRDIVLKTYRIVYRIRGQMVEVVPFWHTARGTPEIDSDEFST